MPRYRFLAAVHPKELGPVEFAKGLCRAPIPNIIPRLAVVGDIPGVNRERLDSSGPPQNLAWELPGIGGSELVLKLAGLELGREFEQKNYVARRAAEVAMQGWLYAGTMDVHTILGNCTRFAQIDSEYRVSGVMLGALKRIGMQNIVRMSAYGGTPHFSPNTVVAELEARDFVLRESEMRNALDDMANSPNPPVAIPAEFKWFDLIPYSPNVDEGQASPKCLGGYRFESFKPLPKKIAKRILPGEVIERLNLPANIVERLCLQGYSRKKNDKGFWTDLVIEGEAPTNLERAGLPEKPSFLGYYQVQGAPEWRSTGQTGGTGSQL